jgi:hypothetical protein
LLGVSLVLFVNGTMATATKIKAATANSLKDNA